eukprot:15357940-Ditylum_brightwellii.AAC.1
MGYKSDLAKRWQDMRMLKAGLCYHHTPCHTIHMKRPNGNKATSDKENAEVFAKHFNNPSPLPCNASVLSLVPQYQEFTHLASPPMHDKIANTILCMQNGKAPGPTGVTSDVFCAMIWRTFGKDSRVADADTEFLINYIMEILCLFWITDLDIESWITGTLALVPKKGDLSDPNKWRPVCLLKTAYKENIPIPTFNWFPMSKNGCVKGHLRKQGKAKDILFPFKKSLYVDDSAFLFDSHSHMTTGANIIYLHFCHFGLSMRIGEAGKLSKTEAVVCAAP